jgi:Spy/CpxP family protein refolding chaperone
MSRKVYLYFALTFALGVIIGGCGVYYFAWYTGHWHRGFNKERVVHHLQKELNLSPSQIQQVNQIFDDAGNKYRDMQNKTAPQFEAIRQETRDRIRQILNPEQISKFDQLVRHADERRKQRTH